MIILKRSLAIGFSMLCISQYASASSSVCNDDDTFSKDSLKFIRKNYCVKRDDSSYYDSKYVDGKQRYERCWRDKCKDKQRTKLYEDMLKDKNLKHFTFATTDDAVENEARIRIQLDKLHEKEARKLASNMIKAAKEVQVKYEPKNGEFQEKDFQQKLDEMVENQNSALGRQAKVKQYIANFEDNKLNVPENWSNLAKGKAEKVTSDVFNSISSEHNKGISNHIAAATANLKIKRNILDQGMSAKDIKRRLKSKRKTIEDKMMRVVKSKCGNDALDSDKVLHDCVNDKKNEGLGQKLDEARKKYEDLANTEDELDKALKNSTSAMVLLMMSQNEFDQKYGVSGSKKAIDKISDSVLGNIMTEIACKVKTQDQACNSVIGDKEIHDLHINNKEINKFFEATKPKTKSKKK